MAGRDQFESRSFSLARFSAEERAQILAGEREPSDFSRAFQPDPVMRSLSTRELMAAMGFDPEVRRG